MASELRVDRIIPTTGVPTGGGGGIIQVVEGSTNTQVAINSQTYTDIGLSATITPKFSTSKILVITNHQVYAPSSGDNNFYFGIRILRDSTTIYNPVQDGNGPFDFGQQAHGSASTTRTWYDRCIPPQVLDSPNTTSAVTYKTQCRTYSTSNNGTIHFQYDTTTNGSSFITLMEISG